MSNAARKLEAVLGTAEQPEPDDEAADLPTGPNLPGDFWQARPELAHIRQAAHNRGRSADAVFGVVLARVAAVTPPWLTLPAIVGTPAPLNVLIALIGNAGSGKSSGAGVGSELVPIDPGNNVAVVPIGSGEGLIDAYLGTVDEMGDDGKRRPVRRQVNRAVLAELDEGQALAELGSRRGATLLPTIRSAWSGARLGQQNADEARRRNLPPHSYRFALLAGFQYETAVPLLDDVAGGTPQRFVFFAAEDPTIPDDPPPWPGELDLTPTNRRPGHMHVAPEVAEVIRSASVASARGEVVVDQLDAHRNLSRLKVAALLAILNHRHAVTADDWHLAGVVLDASDRVRARIQWAARDAANRAEQATTARLARRAADLEGSETERARLTMARAIARHVHRGACDGGCTRRCVARSTSGKHRTLATVDDALDEARGHGWIVDDGPTIRPGEDRP